MPIASFQLPNGKIADFEVPAGLSQEEIEQAVAPELRRLVAPPPPPKQEESGFFRQTLDVPIGIAKGAASGVRALSDIFGANNPVSRAISGTEDYLDSLLSAQARNDQQEIARIMKEAEDKGLGAQVAAGVKAFATAPVDFLSQALGSAVPIVAGGLAASVARLGALGVGAVTTGLGAGTGAGIVKGSIYDAVKGALTEAGESPEVAEARAQAAQSYGGENWGQILTGTALGGLAGRTGVEKLLLDRFGKQEIAGQAAKGVGRRAAEGAVTEAVPEMAQAGQEQLAQNIALQREGFETPTLRGVAGAATLEGLAGGALGGGLGAISRGAPPEAAPPAEPTAEAPPAPPVVTNYQTIDQAGNPATISVAQDNTGTIVATGPDGEPVDLSNMVSAGFTIEDSIKSVFSAPEAPVVPAAPESAVAPRVEPEITLPSAPEITLPFEAQPARAAEPTLEVPPPFETTPVSQEPLPKTPEEVRRDQEMTELSERADRISKVDRENSLLEFFTYRPKKDKEGKPIEVPDNRLDVSEVTDIASQKTSTGKIIPDKAFNFIRKKGGQKISTMISDQSLNEWLPFELRIYGTETAEELADKEPAAEEYIKEALRNSDFLPYETKMELDTIGMTLDGIETEIQREIELDNLRDILAEIAAEEESARDIEQTLPEGTPTGAAEPARPTRIESAAQRIAPQVGDIISRRPLPDNMEARVFKTTDGYGVSLYDKDSGNVVSGSVIRYKGADAQVKAEARAKKLEDETTKPKKGLAAEEKAIADRERGLFALQPQVSEKVGAPTGDLFGAEGAQQIRPSAPKPSRVPEGQLNLFNSDKDFVENSSSAVSGSPENIAEAQRVEKALKGKTPIQAAKWMAANATNPDFRLIAKRVVDRMQKLMDAGIPFKLHIVGVGDKVPVRLLSADGLTSSLTNRSEKKVVSVDIWLNNSTVTGRVGTEEKIVLHELIHAVTAGANFLGNLKSMQGTEAAKLFTRLYDVRNAVVRHFNSRVKSVPSDQLTALEKKVYIDGANALKDEDEVLAWGLTDPDMQEYLESIPYKGQTAWNAFVDAIREFLGLPKAKETALSEVLAISDLLFEAPLVEVGQTEAVKAAPPAQPIANQDQISLFNASVRGEKVKMIPTAEGQAALDTINDLGRQVEETPTTRQKVREYWDNATDNPQATKEAAKKATVRFLDKIETMVFSSDAALNNATRRLINETTMSEQEKMGVLLSISSSQAVHPDALANLFIRYGGLNYDPSIYKYVAVDKKDNFVSLVQGIDTIGAKYGLTKQQAERVSHTAFEAKRLSSIARFNRALKVEIDDLRDMARTSSDPTARDLASKEVRRKVKDFKFVHMTDEQIQRGLDLFKTIPELNALVDTWNGIRENSRKELVESGLWSEQEAEGLLSNMDYVPFYREDQLEKGKGPKEFLRNLQVQAKEKKLKGSDKPVADIFDNMARWTQYAVKRSVMNRLALAKIDAAVEMGIAKQVEKQTQGDNSVRVWRNGNAEYYSLDDPLFMDAFTGLESVAIPSLKYFAKLSNLLRQSVVLYPLFSVSQVPQDAFAAMFSSGLKTRFALTIPARAVKEFVKTLFKSSQTHKELERIGVVGIRDFTAAIAREDAEIYAGLKARPGVLNKVKSVLEHIAMSSDNAVRQAVYEASIAQGVSRAEAIEKAFNLINFRNRGSSKGLAAAGQVIPFFNAYLAAQHVAYRTISGVGISPTSREAALKTLAATTASVMALSLIYAMLIGDDEDYLNKPSVMRDRLFMIPGTGLSIPIRSDIFSIPKIITEHMYMLMTDNGASDGRKFRDSMKAALGNALFSPTVVPQAIKPVFEVGINYNLFQGRPLVGTYQQGLETARQFNDSTSELAKLFGQTGLISPIAADHLIRGMLGSAGGLTLYMTNFALHNDPAVPRPALSFMEAVAALPGTSGFVSKEYETALKNDFYVLRDEVSTAVNTLNDLKKRSPNEIEEFLADETNLTRVGMAKAVNRITKNLTDIRQAISRITNMTSDQMSASEKAEQIRELKAIEREILQNVDLKSLREMANL
jgi:hypothetical protein